MIRPDETPSSSRRRTGLSKETRRSTCGDVTVGLGFVLVGLHLYALRDIADVQGTGTAVLGVLVTLLPSLGIVIAGIRLRGTQLDAGTLRRVLGWVFSGTVALLFVGGTAIAYLSIGGSPLRRILFVSTTFAPLGALAGALAGWYDARGRLSEEQFSGFKNAVEHAAHAILITDTDGTIRYVNPAFEEITGYSRADAIGATPRILNSGEQDEQFYEELWETILSGEVWEGEVVNERADGSTFHISQTIAPITNEEGDPEWFVAVNRDISDFREYERRITGLHTATQEMIRADTPREVCRIAAGAAEALLGFPLNGVWLYDEDTDRLEPTAWTDEVEALGIEPPIYENGNSLSWDAFETGEMRVYDDLRADRTNAYDPETPIRGEIILSLGEYGVMNVGKVDRTPFTDEQVRVVQLLGENLRAALRQIDVEETLRSRERDLKRHNERLEEFASIVSHDLRNPLTVARGRLEMASAECESDHLEEALQSLDRMDRLIDDVLTLTRQGETIEDTEPVRVRDVSLAAWKQVDTRRATIEPPSEGIVTADRRRLQRLLENLFRNAVKHGGPEVTVRVGLEDEGLYVEDTGSGFRETSPEQLFESGFTTVEDGTGLGLSIARQIAEAHGWGIAAKCGRDGGARFELIGVNTPRSAITE